SEEDAGRILGQVPHDLLITLPRARVLQYAVRLPVGDAVHHFRRHGDAITIRRCDLKLTHGTTERAGHILRESEALHRAGIARPGIQRPEIAVLTRAVVGLHDSMSRAEVQSTNANLVGSDLDQAGAHEQHYADHEHQNDHASEFHRAPPSIAGPTAAPRAP